MDPFDVQKAVAGAQVCTRNGNPVVIKAIRNSNFCFPVVCDVLTDENRWREIRYKYDGHEFGHGESPNDLFLR